MWGFIILGIIIFYIWVFASDSDSYKKILEDQHKRRAKEYKEERNLNFINEYVGSFLDGFDDVGYCKHCSITVFDNQLEIFVSDGLEFKKTINICIDDIKGAKIITERHLIEEDNTKENKKNFLKYGLVGEKLLESEKEVTLTGINLVELNIFYENKDVALLFKFTSYEHRFIQDINNLTNKNNKSDLAN